MIIIGCDCHPGFQEITFVVDERIPQWVPYLFLCPQSTGTQILRSPFIARRRICPLTRPSEHPRQADIKITRPSPRYDCPSGRGWKQLLKAFNLFNNLNVTDINTVYGAPDFIGSEPQRFNDKAPAPSPDFGAIRAIAPPRQIQLALRVVF